MTQGEPFITALLQSLKLLASFRVDRTLLSRIVSAVEKKFPGVKTTPLPLIQFFKNMNLTFNYKGADDLDESFRKVVF